MHVCVQTGLGKTPDSLRALQNLRTEALLQATLNHASVLGLSGVEIESQEKGVGATFAGFFMQWLQGGSLAEALRYYSRSQIENQTAGCSQHAAWLGALRCFHPQQCFCKWRLLQHHNFQMQVMQSIMTSKLSIDHFAC